MDITATRPSLRRITTALTLGTILATSVWSPANAEPDRNPSRRATADETRTIGRSVENRPILARRYGPVDGTVVVAVGSIHGNERPGIPIVRDLANGTKPDDYTLWVIETANPDGTVYNTRHNVNGVDLNRNFPTAWGRQPCPGKTCSGPRAASEPETRALIAFFDTVDPRLVVFYHSVGNLVDLPAEGVANPAALRAYARRSGQPVKTMTCGPGGCTGNATQHLRSTHPQVSAFVVELPCDNQCLTETQRRRHTDAFWAAATRV